MKLVTRPRLLLLAVVIAIVAGGVWLDRRDAPIREGRVVIDEAFLRRVEVDNPETTRDPAVKALADAQLKRELLRNMLRGGTVTVDVHRVNRDSVRVTIWEGFDRERDTFTTSEYTRYRYEWWVALSPRSWKEMLLHRPYWVPHSYNEWMRARYD